MIDESSLSSSLLVAPIGRHVWGMWRPKLEAKSAVSDDDADDRDGLYILFMTSDEIADDVLILKRLCAAEEL